MGRCSDRLTGPGSSDGGPGPCPTGVFCCHCGRMTESGSDGTAVAEAARPAEAVEEIRGALIDLVGAVLGDRRAHTAYAVFGRVDEIAERGYRRDDVYESCLGAALVLAAVADRAASDAGSGTVEAVAWVRDNLGAWASTAAARAGATLELPTSSAVADVVMRDVQDDLREHVLPALIWLAAGIVAVAGAGDEGWLRRVSDSS